LHSRRCLCSCRRQSGSDDSKLVAPLSIWLLPNRFLDPDLTGDVGSGGVYPTTPGMGSYERISEAK
jgi:hypothetical protein